MESLLRDDDAHAALVAAAAYRSPRSWDDYAAEVWEFFTGPVDSSAQASPGA